MPTCPFRNNGKEAPVMLLIVGAGNRATVDRK